MIMWILIDWFILCVGMCGVHLKLLSLYELVFILNSFPCRRFIETKKGIYGKQLKYKYSASQDRETYTLQNLHDQEG